MQDLDQIRILLTKCSRQQRQEIFQQLRNEFPIHPIEKRLNVDAEVILEAISKASDLTLRGIRGVIAEASFEINIASRLSGWKVIPVHGDLPYDCLITDGKRKLRIQVKMQRLKNHRPMMAREAYRYLSSDMFVVETQRTRGGIHPVSKKSTRPYSIGEFDILAVSLHPSTNDWHKFVFTLERWLIPSSDFVDSILKFQPVPQQANADWTDDLQTCIRWYSSQVKKTIKF